MGWGGGLHDFSVSPSPLGTNWVLELGWTGFGVGLVGLGTGLDNFLHNFIILPSWRLEMSQSKTIRKS